MKLSDYKVVQGGMGVGVSGWQLAKTVGKTGQIGTVSGTVVANLLADALQKGDIGEIFRKALATFPYPQVVEMVMKRYFVEGGIKEGEPQRPVPHWSLKPSKVLIGLTVCANYAFVKLAKTGHTSPVFVNYLEKIQMPHVFSIFGAMLANVDGIVMGAGIPKEIPPVIDGFMNGGEVSYPIYVKGLPPNSVCVKFNPSECFGANPPSLSRPAFLPIVSSHVLAMHLHKSNPQKIDGFIVELPTAGGHNAPPRGKFELTESGEPIYGARDEIDWQKVRDLGVPFWVAGSLASPEGLEKALALGACGIQAGTIFALSRESGILPGLKQQICTGAYRGELKVHTSLTASPTGFPFKVVQLQETLSNPDLYASRPRVCNIGHLREAVSCGDGNIIWRCSAEPVEDYVKKGGDLKDTEGRLCLCNALLSTVGARDSELPVVTSGDDMSFLHKLMKDENSSYTAEEAVSYLLGESQSKP